MDQKLIDAFKTEICDKSDEVDPSEEMDWFGLSMGFFIAKGCTIDEAHELALHVRYDKHYWM